LWTLVLVVTIEVLGSPASRAGESAYFRLILNYDIPLL
jgi:hypothetical protein